MLGHHPAGLSGRYAEEGPAEWEVSAPTPQTNFFIEMCSASEESSKPETLNTKPVFGRGAGRVGGLNPEPQTRHAENCLSRRYAEEGPAEWEV